MPKRILQSNPSVVEMQERLERKERGDFTKMLADLLQVQPSKKARKRLAEVAPDRYYKAVLDVMKAAGFADKHEHMHNGMILVQNMSMSQLEDELAKMGIDPSSLLDLKDVTPKPEPE